MGNRHPQDVSMSGESLPQNGGFGVAGYRDKDRIHKYRWGRKKGARRARRRTGREIVREALE